jgi:hypothetical protein
LVEHQKAIDKAKRDKYRQTEKGAANDIKNHEVSHAKRSGQRLANTVARARDNPEQGIEFDDEVIPVIQYKRSKPSPVSAPFPSKANRKFQVPLLYPPNTYMIDLMFNTVEGGGRNGVAVLVIIDTRTRKLWAQPTNPVVGGRLQFGQTKN